MEILFVFLFISMVKSQGSYLNTYSNEIERYKCPEHWIQFQQSCYRFIKSPLRVYNEAKKICQAYDSELVAVNNLDEHGFLVHQLTWQDPQHRLWYTAAYQQSLGYWANPVDGTQLLNVENAFLPDNTDTIGKDYLVYGFSNQLMRWGFKQVRGDEPLLYICEAPIANLQYLVIDERTLSYGIDVDNPEKVPQGPYFMKQPTDKTFDISKRTILNEESLSCLAGGYPTPTYEWYKEEYVQDKIISKRIDPLSNNKYTISGGTLLIYNPQQEEDNGKYHCKATNKYGTIISESVNLNFGYILEFNMKRSAENGQQNWGKVLNCDPPQYFPGVTYYWARDYFPNFVEEDKRVFVSHDGALYFSALEYIDRGNYSCIVQSKVSDNGRNGPFFVLGVLPHSNYQQLKFANNFPKVFPEAPIAGQEVRLECMAFGYPVPSYNWIRSDGMLPRGSYQLSHNRVLVIPHVKVEDQGKYICKVHNDRASMEHSITLNIQAEPNFTIPLTDKHIDKDGDVTWTCEAFGIPDVNYTWWKNGKILVPENFDPEDRNRIHIQDNVLTIKNLNPQRDPGMYQCRAENQLKLKFSSAQLRVLSLKPSFKKRPLESETYAAESGNVTIACNPEAAPHPKFVWKKDGNVIGAGGHRQILENGNLIINPVSRDDEGVYTCTASNIYGMDESHGRLIVLHGPVLVESLNPKVVIQVNRNSTLNCIADKEEILDIAYIWTHNGLRIRDHDININHRLKIEGGHLEIINASFLEAGDYECIVKSAVGRISSKSRIIVNGPPGPPGGVQVINIEKTSVKLQWTDGTDHGRPILRYIVSARTNWNRTWVNISQSLNSKQINRYTGRKEAIIENVLIPWSAYEFRISAANDLGVGPPSASSPQYSTPEDRPYTSPSNIGGGGGKIGDLTITWSPLSRAEQNGNGIYYRIFWRRTGHDSEFQSTALKEFHNINMFVVNIPLDFYYTKYDVKVQAINNIGAGPISEPVTIYSAEDMPQVAPQQVYARSFNSTALNVTWMPIDQSRERLRGKLIGHRLKYWKKEFAEEDAVYYLSRSTNPWALIVGLQPDTYYNVKVMAYNAAGEGPESERFLERTFRKAPVKPPSTVEVYQVNPSTIHVKWRYVALSSEEEPLIGYKIRIWEIDQDMSTANDTLILVGGNLEAYIPDLSPGKTYYMRVLAYSNGGDGRMSSPAVKIPMGHVNAYRNSAAEIQSSWILLMHIIIYCYFSF